jgi:hypothetical protein
MALKTANINLYIYTGTSGSYTSNDLKYRLTKDVIGSQGKVVIEIGELVRDYIDNSFDGTTYQSQTLWVTAAAALYHEDGSEMAESPKTYNYLAVDGFGIFEEGMNPDIGNHVMQSNDIMYVPDGDRAQIPVFAESLSNVTFYNGNANIGSQVISDNGNSNQKIQFVSPPNYCTRVVFDSTDDRQILINYICENVHTTHDVHFFNKFGALQKITFFKKSEKTMSIKDKTFKSNTLDILNENYSTNRGQTSRYNVNAKMKITMNTGYVHESFNDVIEQMLLSEKVWINHNNQTVPVIPTSKSLKYKTDVNDKLINYSFDFEFAFDKFNLIR